jgi:hypothetical protein
MSYAEIFGDNDDTFGTFSAKEFAKSMAELLRISPLLITREMTASILRGRTDVEVIENDPAYLGPHYRYKEVVPEVPKETVRYFTFHRWFNVLGMSTYIGARKLRPGENEGWGNRFHAEVHHHPPEYTAGFNNPSFGMTVELMEWRFDLGAEY